MLTKSDIYNFLEDAKIKNTDTVMIHTSLKSIGEIEGGADGLIDAFISYLDEGLFLIPTHTWDNVTPQNPFYDAATTVPCIGKLPEIAIYRKDGIRSLHPTHSVMAFGKDAAEFIKGEELSATPAPVNGCWSRLYNSHAKILLIGVGLDKNTYFHAVDEMLNIPNRLNEKTFEITIKDQNGKLYKSPPFHTHYTKGINCCCSEYYGNFKKPLEKLGALSYSHLGKANVYILDAYQSKQILEGIWKNSDHDLCLESSDIPENYYNIK